MSMELGCFDLKVRWPRYIGFLVPEGPIDNSPAIYRWVNVHNILAVPKGRLKREHTGLEFVRTARRNSPLDTQVPSAVPTGLSDFL